MRTAVEGPILYMYMYLPACMQSGKRYLGSQMEMHVCVQTLVFLDNL